MTTNPKEKYPDWFVLSLAKGLRVIRAFSRESPAMKASEVARKAGMTRAAARRFLLTLVDQGYAGSDGDRFYLRAPLLDIGFAYLSSMSFGNLSQPVLSDLAEKHGETSSIAVLDDIQTLYVARVPERRPLGIGYTVVVGARLPASATTLGRVLLAALPEDELARRLARVSLDPLTPYSITDLKALEEELSRIKAQGYATSANQIIMGLGAIAVPIVNSRGETRAGLNMLLRAPEGVTDIDPTPYLDDMRKGAQQIAAVVEVTNPVAFANSW